MRHEDLEAVRESLRWPPSLLENKIINKMEKGKYLLIHKDKYVYRFECLSEAQSYAINHCQGDFEYYIIVDLEKNEVVGSWYYVNDLLAQ